MGSKEFESGGEITGAKLHRASCSLNEEDILVFSCFDARVFLGEILSLGTEGPFLGFYVQSLESEYYSNNTMQFYFSVAARYRWPSLDNQTR